MAACGLEALSEAKLMNTSRQANDCFVRHSPPHSETQAVSIPHPDTSAFVVGSNPLKLVALVIAGKGHWLAGACASGLGRCAQAGRRAGRTCIGFDNHSSSGRRACSPGGSVPGLPHGNSLASVGKVIAFGCTVVSTVTRLRSWPRNRRLFPEVGTLNCKAIYPPLNRGGNEHEI